MAKKTQPQILTHIYPIVGSDTPRLSHTGVPHNITDSSYTKQLQTDIERSVAAEGKCLATLENENLEEVRAYAVGDLVAGAWDINGSGVSIQAITAGEYHGQKLTITNKRVWMVAFNVKAPSGNWNSRAKIFADDGYPGTLIATSNAIKIISSGTFYFQTYVFDTCPNLNGTYRVVVEHTGGNTGHCGYSTSDIITGQRTLGTGTWTDSSSEDSAMKLNYLPDVFFKIYKNGSPIGSEFKNTDSGDIHEIVLSEDLGPFLPDVDSVELWGYVDNSVAGGGNHTCDITVYQLRYDWDSTKIKGAATYS